MAISRMAAHGLSGCFNYDKGIEMQKKLLVSLMIVGLLAACGKKEDSAQQAAPAPAPQTQAAPAAPAASNTLAQGEKIYKGTCAMCHSTGAGGAPMYKDKAEWGPRVAQGNETLYDHALKGFNGNKGAMPAKGGNATLSDDDVKAAVDYMVAAVK